MGLTMKSNNELEKLFNKFAILPDDKDKKKNSKNKELFFQKMDEILKRS